MKSAMLAAGLVVASFGCEEAPSNNPAADAGADDGVIDLRLDQIQIKGTHNSYHIAPDMPVLDDFDYTHAPLTAQLNAGIRQFEFDIHPEAEDLAVYHLPGIDEVSHCPTLVDCLAEIERWSADNPGHHALLIFIEPKFIHRRHTARIDSVVASAWPRERMVTPDDVRGKHADLRTALLAAGWPTVEDTRGKALFFLFDDGVPRDHYVDADPSLAGRLLFPRVGSDELDAPYAAFAMRDEVDDALFEDMIARRILVRTRADDAENRARAIEVGAHILSFDFPERWPGGSRCNPVTAPPACRTDMLESP